MLTININPENISKLYSTKYIQQTIAFNYITGLSQ